MLMIDFICSYGLDKIYQLFYGTKDDNLIFFMFVNYNICWLYGVGFDGFGCENAVIRAFFVPMPECFGR